MRRQQYVEACSKFRESDSLDPSPGTRLNWALCDEKVGHLAEALEHARWVLDRLGADDNRRPIAERVAADLEKRVAYLTVRLVPGASGNSKVYLDGKQLAMHGEQETRAVDPGEHVIFVEQPSHEAGREVLTLRAGETAVREVAAGPQWHGREATASAFGPAGGRFWTLRRTAGFALVGGASAALAATAVMGVLALNESSIVSSECPGGFCSIRGFEAADRGRTFVHVGGVTLATAVAAATSAAFLLWPRGSATRESIAVLPGGAELMVTRGF
jgi:hypothetical protein